jgi:hypothetical protein
VPKGTDQRSYSSTSFFHNNSIEKYRKKPSQAAITRSVGLKCISSDIEQRKLLTIEKFFDILKDGEWHDLTNISDQIEVQTSKLTEFTLFLTQQGIISYEDKTHRIKIKAEWQDAFPDEN